MPRTPGQQGPDPLSPRRPLRNGSFGGKGPGKLNAFGGAPERGKKVNTPGSGGSWGGGGGKKTGGDGCAVLILGGLGSLGAAGTALAGAIGGWWS